MLLIDDFYIYILKIIYIINTLFYLCVVLGFGVWGLGFEVEWCGMWGCLGLGMFGG